MQASLHFLHAAFDRCMKCLSCLLEVPVKTPMHSICSCWSGFSRFINFQSSRPHALLTRLPKRVKPKKLQEKSLNMQSNFLKSYFDINFLSLIVSTVHGRLYIFGPSGRCTSRISLVPILSLTAAQQKLIFGCSCFVSLKQFAIQHTCTLHTVETLNQLHKNCALRIREKRFSQYTRFLCPL